jgi:hypothetical protein
MVVLLGGFDAITGETPPRRDPSRAPITIGHQSDREHACNRSRPARVRFRVRLTADGEGHAATRVRYVGRMSRTLKRQTRELLRTVEFRVAGDIVQTVFTATGQQQTSMPFAPRARRC